MFQHDQRFLRSTLLGSGVAACLWLTLALDGCSGSTEPAPGGGGSAGQSTAGSGGKAGSGGVSMGGKTTGGGGNSAGIGGEFGGDGGVAGGGGAAGDGGVAGEAGADSGPRVVSLTHQGDVWLVKFENIAGLYTLSCSGNEPSLVEQDAPQGATTPPPFGQFYIDDQYFDIPQNLGCDFQVCQQFPAQMGISDTGYLAVAPRPRPGSGEGGAGGENGLGGEGGDNGEVPAFATYEIDGPFVLRNRYFTDSKCTKLVVRSAEVLTP